MFHLRLIKGLSYDGAVRASAGAPDVFTDDPEKYKAALKSGYFKAIQDVPAAPDEGADLSKMTVDKLREYAKENGISLTGCSTKSEILQKINEFEADAYAAAEILRQSGDGTHNG